MYEKTACYRKQQNLYCACFQKTAEKFTENSMLPENSRKMRYITTCIVLRVMLRKH
jgi:hypothetical protein